MCETSSQAPPRFSKVSGSKTPPVPPEPSHHDGNRNIKRRYVTQVQAIARQNVPPPPAPSVSAQWGRGRYAAAAGSLAVGSEQFIYRAVVFVVVLLETRVDTVDRRRQGVTGVLPDVICLPRRGHDEAVLADIAGEPERSGGVACRQPQGGEERGVGIGAWLRLIAGVLIDLVDLSVPRVGLSGLLRGRDAPVSFPIERGDDLAEVAVQGS